jgi:biotin carboxylase
MPRVLLLVTTRTYRAGAFLAAARTLGVAMTVGSERAQVLESLNPAGHLVLDFRDPAGCVARIAEFAAFHPFTAVIAADDECAVLAALACERFGLAAHTAAAVETARDKQRSREAFRRAGLPAPGSFSMRVAAAAAVSGSEAESAATRARFPCVLKPRGLSASRGVIRADSPEEFRAAFARIARLLRDEPPAVPGEPPLDEILVEDFIPGVEVALEGLVSAGALRVLAVFDKPDPLDGPFFEETIYVTPSRHPAEARAAIVEAAGRAVAALGLGHGPVHAELRWDGTRAWPLEIAPRSIGGLCSRALRFGEGQTLEMLLLRHALGQDVSHLERERAASGVMMIPIPRAGIFRGVRGIERAVAVPGVSEVRITVHPGARLVPLPEGAQYLGFLFSRGAEPAEAEASLREAHRELSFDIESASPADGEDGRS